MEGGWKGGGRGGRGVEGGWKGWKGGGFLLACRRSHIIPITDRDDLSVFVLHVGMYLRKLTIGS